MAAKRRLARGGPGSNQYQTVGTPARPAARHASSFAARTPRVVSRMELRQLADRIEPLKTEWATSDDDRDFITLTQDAVREASGVGVERPYGEQLLAVIELCRIDLDAAAGRAPAGRAKQLLGEAATLIGDYQAYLEWSRTHPVAEPW